MNWENIRKEYETSSVTLKELADKHDIKLGTLKSRKSREGWSRDATKKDATQNEKVATTKNKDATVKPVPDVVVESTEELDRLTEKQRRFVEEYLIDLNATQAAIRTGYSEKRASEIGYQQLQKTTVQEAIQKAKVERSKRVEITADRVLQEYAKIGFSNISDYLRVKTGETIIDYVEDEDGNKKPIMAFTQDVEVFDTEDILREKLDAVAEIKRTRDGIALKLHDKKGALDSMARHLGMFVDKQEVNVNTNNKLEDFFK